MVSGFRVTLLRQENSLVQEKKIQFHVKGLHVRGKLHGTGHDVGPVLGGGQNENELLLSHGVSPWSVGFVLILSIQYIRSSSQRTPVIPPSFSPSRFRGRGRSFFLLADTIFKNQGLAAAQGISHLLPGT
jgi:hypothetical protein